MWCERYTIVVMSLRRTHLPSAWGDFHGTFWDWATLFGTVGLFLTGILLAVRFLPVISMFEMRALLQRRSTRRRAPNERRHRRVFSKRKRRCASAVQRLSAADDRPPDIHAEIDRGRTDEIRRCR